MLLVEGMEKAKQKFTLQVFATDIDSQAIAVARSGTYPASIAMDITEERLSRFFTPEPSMLDEKPLSYRINKSIRDLLIFSEQDVLRDPPFSRLDLISCRNLMIYLDGDLQKKLIQRFHYALNPDGLLFLGTSETVGESADLFAVLDRKARLYQRKKNTSSTGNSFPGAYLAARKTPDEVRPGYVGKNMKADKISLKELAEQTLLKRLAPSSALVNGQGDIFYLHGRTGMYLEPPTGEVGAYNILSMAREGLTNELATALRKAVHTGDIVRCPGLRVKTNAHFTPVDLSICPVGNDSGDSSSPVLYLVLLQEGQEIETGHDQDLALQTGSPEDSIIISLKQELRAKEEYLQSANEELETANEELKSSNEEMQSVNEELQSTNEELETSREELQSVNEELATVNTELQSKVADLSIINNDMNNLLSGTGIATVFVDHQMCILRYTPTVTVIINLVKGDVGRPIHHFVNNLVGYETMIEDIQAVLDTLIPKELDVVTMHGIWFTMRIQPYRTIDNIIEGAVINFVDITDRKQAEDKVGLLLSEKELILREVNHRIKNNMCTMKAMLDLQARGMADKKASAALLDASSRMHSMEILYDKLYQSSNFSELSVREYLSFLVDGITRNYSGVLNLTVVKQFDDFILDAERLQPLGIIINELLTNAMKYAFIGRPSGVVKVEAGLVGGRVSVAVADDGKGMPESIDFENSTGFGLMLVQGLAMQIKASTRIEREKGTRISLEFDLNHPGFTGDRII